MAESGEILDIASYQESGNLYVTPVAPILSDTANGLVRDIRQRVQEAHKNPQHLKPDAGDVIRAQTFEEGNVFMAAPTVPNFPANMYLMDFFDVTERGMCSRPHNHTGPRFVFIITGSETELKIASLSSIITKDTGLQQEKDKMPGLPEGIERDRYTLTIPPNSYYSVQIPEGVSHQFNAIGPNAVIVTVHPEESRELTSHGFNTNNMTEQTRFLTAELPDLEQCGVALGEVGMDMAVQALSSSLRPATAMGSRHEHGKIWTAVAKAGLAASILIGGTVAKLGHNLSKAAADFHAKNPVALVLDDSEKSDISDMGAAYGVPDSRPTHIYLPEKLYDLAKASPDYLKDPALVAWAADRVILRTTNGAFDPDQAVFKYGEGDGKGSHAIHTVTVGEFKMVVDSLVENIAKAERIPSKQDPAISM